MALRSKVFTYQAELVWQGGRTARSSRPVTCPSSPSRRPRSSPGGGDDRWSPEHLYLASLESCTMLSFLAHCAHNDLDVEEYSSGATGSLRAPRRRSALRVHPRRRGRARAHGAGPRRGGPRADRQGRARLLHLGLDHRHASRRTGRSPNECPRPLRRRRSRRSPDTRAAAEDVAERVRDGLAGAPADLAFLFLSPEHVADAEDAAAAVVAVLRARSARGLDGRGGDRHRAASSRACRR